MCTYAQHGDLQLKISLLYVHWLLYFFVASLHSRKCYSECRLIVDPHFGAPLCSLAALANCSRPPGPDANDVYLFSVLCCKLTRALACQTALDRSGVMEQWRLSSGFITHAKNLGRGDLPSLVAFIASNDPYWAAIIALFHSVGARVIASSVL